MKFETDDMENKKQLDFIYEILHYIIYNEIIIQHHNKLSIL